MLRKRTDLKIACGPVSSEGVTVGKTHQGDHVVPLGFAHTHYHRRSGLGAGKVGGGQVKWGGAGLCFTMT